MKTLFVILLSVFQLGLLSPQRAAASSATLYYSDGPWSGKVIDAETKEPIEGAVVVAVWKKIYSTLTGDSSYFFDAIETITDRTGNFSISNFKAVNMTPVIARIEGPRFTIFKPAYSTFPGYKYFHKYFPHSPLKVDSDTLAELFKKGVVIELSILKTKEERLDAQSEARPLGDIPDEKIPNLLNLINTERRNLGLDPIHVKKGR